MKTLDQVNSRIFDSKIAWQSIDHNLALANTRVLDLLREASLVESFFPAYMAKMISLFWDDISATSIFTIESMEAYGHYFVTRKYLEVVNYRPISDQEVIELRVKDKDTVYNNKVRELVNFMGTEHFAAEFFGDLAKMTEEPVLKSFLPRFSAEEVTHSNFAFDLLEKLIAENPKTKEEVLKYALKYRHVGSYVMPEVRPAKDDNLRVIQSFNEKIGRLVGKRISDALADSGR